MNIFSSAFHSLSSSSILKQNSFFTFSKGFATKKGAGTSTNGRDSNPKYLGFKKVHGQKVIPGNIIVRQKGSKFHEGEGVGRGRDFTLWAKVPGVVFINTDRFRDRKYVHVIDQDRFNELMKIRVLDVARRSPSERSKIWPFIINMSKEKEKEKQLKATQKQQQEQKTQQ